MSSDTSMDQIAALPGSLADRDLVEVPEDWGLPPLGRTHIYLADDGSDTAKAFAALITPDLRSIA